MKRKIMKRMVGMLLVISVCLCGFDCLEHITQSRVKVQAEEDSNMDLILQYDEPAQDWESQALPIGNGKIGAMIFGGVETEKIQVNEESVWSGGPGADNNYDGGDNELSAQNVHTALQDVRTQLQEMVTEFSSNSAAYIDENGKLITNDYQDLTKTSAFSSVLEKLKGEKNNFGTFQTLSNIKISDPLYSGAKVLDIVTNANTGSNVSEKTNSIFDNDDNTKWFTGFGFNTTATIQWKYNRPVSISSYTMVSGNDEEGRDPKNWCLYGSVDGVNFTLLDEQSEVIFNERKEHRAFGVENSGTYEYYKIEISQNAEGNNSVFQLTDIIIDGSLGGEAEYSDYRRTSNINQAIETVTYTQDNVNYKREYFMNHPSNVMVARLTADQSEKITRDISIDTEHTNSKVWVDAVNGTVTMTGQPADQSEDGLTFAQQIKIIANGGSVTKADDTTLSVKNADSVILLMTAGTNYKVDEGTTYNYFKDIDPLEEVEQRLTRAQEKSYDDLWLEHVNDYKSLFDRVELNLGGGNVPEKMTDDLLKDYNSDNTEEENRYLETLFYQYGRYLLIASSREDSLLPANLQGIWAQGLSPAWNSDYHTNINLQMNYWLSEQTNLTECHTPVINYINSLVDKGRETAQKYYCQQDGEDVRGWVIHHENNIWGNTNPSTYTTAFYFPAAAAWMCQDIWEKYQFNYDKAFLEENYEVMMEAALFWVDNLWEDERDGSLVANPSYSPEHGVFSLGCTSDQAIIWELFEEVIQASEILGKSDERVQEVINAQERLHMPGIGLGGQLAEWKDETTLEITNYDNHRHQNQLFVLHPGTYVVAGRSEWDDKMIDAAKVTLETRGDGGTGWSKAWKINMWARMRDGDRAHKLLSEQLTGSTLTNLFDTHAPYQIDGNFGATSGMTEMLLQSQGEGIELLPALPSDWYEGSVKGIKARGNFEIDMEWSGGILTQTTLVSNSGNECKLKAVGVDTMRVYDASACRYIVPTEISENEIMFPTRAGAKYIVGYTDFAVAPTVTTVPTKKTEVVVTPSVNVVLKNVPAEGTVIFDSKKQAKYKVTKSDANNAEVEYVSSVNKKVNSVVIPATVTIDNVTYKVTGIAKNAFKNCNKLKKVIIGKNVTKISKKAFYGCKKLKQIIIKTTKLNKKRIGNQAFKGIHKKAVIKVPKSKLKSYRTVFKTKGIGKKVKIKE